MIEFREQLVSIDYSIGGAQPGSAVYAKFQYPMAMDHFPQSGSEAVEGRSALK